MASSRVPGERLDRFWQQAREPVFWLGPDLKILWVNRAWEELTGHPAGEAVGLVCQAHGPTRAGDLDGLAGSFYPPPESRVGQPSGGPTLIIHPSGERRWRRVEFRPFHDAEGALIGLIGLVTPADAPTQVPDSDSLRLRAELMEVRNRLQGRHGFDSLIGHGPAHRRLLDQVAAAALTMVPALIVGESGTGKRTIARTIHQQGPRPHAPIVPFDCAALPAEVLERDLFGSIAGDMPPRLTLPEGATLLIGDILDLPRDLQARLASSLDPRVRLLATSTGDLDAAVREERLRPELYFALTTMVIRLDPLRERLDELPVLAQHLLERANLRESRQRSGFTPEAIDAMLSYDWPGNLRELARVVDDSHGRGAGDAISADDLPAAIRGHLASAYAPPPLPPPVAPLDDLLTQVERRLIESALQHARQNKSRAAEMLGISRPRLYRRIKDLDILDEPEPADEVPTSNGSRA